ncbi:tRNA (N6-isopentenyl adenosine(37)-C2)-methylthiotransferase MiaB [Ferrovum sp.]|uniref:tRNA (N6-isopentenyl adenosine(37)-C2)-methylthiotransferase MiaB n=1 Tax=Ferrovum sp. TaxID=2609467 RepID=UPI00262EA1F9|nr:tRNA (N6-isopentenyl adenosine(37)-C2)-methylthiotransferase MiaB [Ferrovum sp.]
MNSTVSLPPPGRKVHIKTFGCQMNVYDSEKILALLQQSHAMEPTEDMASADLIIFNTCSVREKAEEKFFSELGRAHEFKLAQPGVVIAVGGCVASQEGQALLDRAPYVDVVFGPQTLHRLPELMRQRQRSGRNQLDISFPEIEKFDALPAARVEGPTAFVSIMEGCSKYCSFCVVPYTRGEEFSRPIEAVLEEIRLLARRGVREVTLLGQNVNAWLNLQNSGTDLDFAHLLTEVCTLEGIERVRYTTSHPLEVTPGLIAAHERLPKLASQIHLPVQSGSNRILAAMKRGYTVESYKEIVTALRQAKPGLSLTSDFIIGFPGETDEDFAATLQLIEEVGFDGSYGFMYSPRPGTPAADLPDTVPLEVKRTRLQALLARTDAHAFKISTAMVGTQQRILVDGHARRHTLEMRGRTDNNRVVNFPGGERLVGHFVDVRITATAPHTLRGELVDLL